MLIPSLGRGAGDFDRLAADLATAGFDPRAVEPAASVPEGSTLHDLAALVVRTMDRDGIAVAHLVGHAFGQRLARCVAADHPERVLTLTLIAAGGHVPMSEEVAASLRACFDAGLPPGEHLDHVRRAFFADGNDPAVWRDGWHPEVAAYQAAALGRTDPDDWRNASAARVLVIQGLQDACAVPENGRRYVAEHPDRAELVEIDGAGHALLPEQPEAVAEALIAFLDRA